MQKTKLKNHQLITTDDGSLSAFSKTYGENFHNTTGAASETRTHYIEGCQVPNRARQQKNFSILEVGLGLGVGFEQTFIALKDIKTKIHFTSLEIDEELILYLRENNPLFKPLGRDNCGYSAKIDQFHLQILLGDARETLQESQNLFHAIYQDAFSPKRNSTLWTREWFELLYRKSHEDCVMSTYSSSSSIRKSMLAAGWKIKEGVKFGPKRSSTRAFKSGESDPGILECLERSPSRTLTDENAKDYHL